MKPFLDSARFWFVGALALGAASLFSSAGCSTVNVMPSDSTSSSTSVGGAAGSGGNGAGGQAVGGSGGTMVSSSSVGGAGGQGGSGGAGAGGSGGSPLVCTPDSGGDTCPGDTIALSLGTQACYEGDLATANADYSAKYCSSAAVSAGRERVYHLTFDAVGTLKFIVNSSEFDPTLHGRRLANSAATCTDSNQEFSCQSFFPSKEGFALEIDPAQIPDLYFFVDSASGPGGKYRIDVSFEPPTCGDSVINPSTAEECDDGNTLNGDGCNSSCKLENVSLYDACPGEPFPIALNQSLLFNSTTAPYKDGDGMRSYHPLQAPGCGVVAYKSTARDRVYQVKAKANGTLSASVGLDITGTISVCDQDLFDSGCWDRVLYAVEAVNPGSCGASCTCDSGMTIPGDPLMGAQLGTQLGCSNKGVYDVETVSFPVVKDRTYFLVVDGNTFAQRPFGNFYLHVSLK